MKRNAVSRRFSIALAVALAIAATLGMLPEAALAAMPPLGDAAMGQPYDGVDYGALLATDTGVYYGTYRHALAWEVIPYDDTQGAAQGVRITQYEGAATPILWRVMGEERSADGSGDGAITLLSEYALDSLPFSNSGSRYHLSLMHDFLYDAGKFPSNFSAGELASARQTTVITSAYNLLTLAYDSQYGSTSQDVFYLPWGTYDDPNGTSPYRNLVGWGAADPGGELNDENTARNRLSQPGDLALKQAYLKGGTAPITWWLRTPDALFAYTTFTVADTGRVSGAAYGTSVFQYGVRPAFKLEPASVLFASEIGGSAAGATAADANYSASGGRVARSYKLTVVSTGPNGPALTGLSNAAGLLQSGTSALSVVSGGSLALTGTGTNHDKLVYKIVDRSTGQLVGYGQGSATDLTVNTAGLAAGGHTLYVWAQKDNPINSHEGSAPMWFPLDVQALTIDSFTLSGAAGTIDDAAGTITVTVPYGTDVTSLTPTFAHTGVSVTVNNASQTSGVTAQDFTNPVTYTVTGPDGATKAYVVTVTKAAPGQTPAQIPPSGPAYTTHTLADSATGVTVSGQLASGAALIVKAQGLHTSGTCTACDDIREWQAAGELILLYDISLSGGHTGELTVSIPVGDGYNGQTVTILHCLGGTLESTTVTVAGGRAVGTFKKLSPFAVVQAAPTAIETPDDDVEVPQTGDNTGTVWLALIWGALLAAAALKTALRRA